MKLPTGYWQLTTGYRFSKITGCRAAVAPSSGRRDTPPQVASVRIGAPLSVKPVTEACDANLAQGKRAWDDSFSHPSKTGLGAATGQQPRLASKRRTRTWGTRHQAVMKDTG